VLGLLLLFDGTEGRALPLALVANLEQYFFFVSENSRQSEPILVAPFVRRLPSLLSRLIDQPTRSCYPFQKLGSHLASKLVPQARSRGKEIGFLSSAKTKWRYTAASVRSVAPLIATKIPIPVHLHLLFSSLACGSLKITSFLITSLRD